MALSTPIPDLAGRDARCTYFDRRKARGAYSSSSCDAGRDAAVCRCVKPSSTDLAFFKFCGEGSLTATICRHCGCYPQAHGDDQRCPDGLRRHKPGTRYEAQGAQAHDEFYCGCHGWD